MEHSRTITLFAEVPSARRGPSGFMVSALVHVAVIFIGYVYMKETVRVTHLIASQRYNVRLINVESPRLRRMPAGGSGGAAPELPAAMMRAADPDGRPASPLIREVVRPIHVAQALVQPDLPPDLLLTKQVSLPQVLIWSAENTPAVTITPPRLPVANTPISQPSLEAPNDQLRIADLKISATAFGSSTLTLPPSTTAPVVVKRPSLPTQMPASVSSSMGPSTPARVISLSDTQLERGIIALPALNAVGAPNGVDDPTAERALAGNSSHGTGKQNATGSGADKGDRGNDKAAGRGNNQVASAGAGGQGSVAHGIGQGGTTVGTADGGGIGDAGTADAASVTEIRQPVDGQFNAVVVGSSIAERYPETMQLWAGRLAYTVYLHMGVEKNWIMQYAVPREAASVGGNATQPHAPWPYLMERPHFAPGDFNSDAIMVHGLLNTSGRFEALAVVFPLDFSQARFVLSALQQWRFRPALQGGKVTAVEVLLIIPEED